MAASEHFSSQNLDLADWPVWRKLIDRLGSVAVTEPRKLSGGLCSRAGSPPTPASRPSAAFSYPSFHRSAASGNSFSSARASRQPG